MTDAEGRGQQIPDKVFMVISRPKSKVYIELFYESIKNLLHKDGYIHNSEDQLIAYKEFNAFLSHPAEVSLSLR